MFDLDTVYALLPGWIRLRDQQQGGPLEDLLSVVVSQVAALEEDLAQTYDNLFIETAAPWVVPYIGDLVQSTPLIDTSRIADTGTVEGLVTDFIGPSFLPQVGVRPRADVANTIFYRRRKTTLPMLEQLAADVTGWAAHVREFFVTLAWTQAIRNHIRPGAFGAPGLRNVPDIDRVDGPFDTTPRTVDVRRPGQLEGRHNIPNVGIYLYRLGSMPLYKTTASAIPDLGRVRIRGQPARPDGTDVHALASGRRRDAADRRAAAAGTDPASRLLRRPRELSGGRDRCGLHPVLWRFRLRGARAEPAAERRRRQPSTSWPTARRWRPGQLQTHNLSTWRQPPAGRRGRRRRARIAELRRELGPAGTAGRAQVQVTWFRGFPADLGGGGYDRQNWLSRRAETGLVTLTVARRQRRLRDNSDRARRYPRRFGTANLLVSMQDSATYVENVTIHTRAGMSRVTIEAVDRHWPNIRGSITRSPINAPEPALCLSGLLVEGAITVTSALGTLAARSLDARARARDRR